jgi:hypothetical protein
MKLLLTISGRLLAWQVPLGQGLRATEEDQAEALW